MSKVYDEPFTEDEQNYLSSKLFKYNEINGCHIWYGGTDRDGYPIIRTKFRNKNRQLFTVHRLQYYLTNNCQFEDKSFHVSHLCHNKTCIKIQHLSLEPTEINSNRNRCKATKTCIGHNGFKNCIFN